MIDICSQTTCVQNRVALSGSLQDERGVVTVCAKCHRMRVASPAVSRRAKWLPWLLGIGVFLMALGIFENRTHNIRDFIASLPDRDSTPVRPPIDDDSQDESLLSLVALYRAEDGCDVRNRISISRVTKDKRLKLSVYTPASVSGKDYLATVNLDDRTIQLGGEILQLTITPQGQTVLRKNDSTPDLPCTRYIKIE
ncbi:MAG: hypothetical protein WBA17_15140 [Saprospiraceae bacterium]